METPEQVVNASAMRYWKQIEAIRVKKAQKIYFWYYNYQDEIIQFIKQAMLKGWRQTTINETRVRVLNVVPRVIDKMALLYKEQPERVLDGGKQIEVDAQKSSAPPPAPVPPAAGMPALPPKQPSPTIIQKEVQSEDDKVYQQLTLDSEIDMRQSEWEKLSKLFNTVLVQPVWREDPEDEESGGHLDFIIHTPAWCCVETMDDDYSKPKSFWYPIWKSIEEGKPQEQVLVFWSETEHHIIDGNGTKANPKGNEDGKNPYGTLPVAVLRRKLSNDFWGEGMWDLVDGNEEICIQVSNLFKVAAFQLHGQPFGVNLNLGGEPVLGADKPIIVDSVEQGTVQPTFEFVTANTNLKPVMDLVDWALKSFQVAKGLGKQQVDIREVISSGVSKMVDNADVQEDRQDTIPVMQEFEEDLYRKVVAVYNYHTKGKKISLKAEFSIKFPEPIIAETQDERTKKRDAGLKNGTMSRIDILMEDYSLSREEAVAKLRQIIAENKEYNDEFGLNAGAMDNVPPAASAVGQFAPKTAEEIALMTPDEKKAYEAELAASKQPQGKS